MLRLAFYSREGFVHKSAMDFEVPSDDAQDKVDL
jgi:hypothetical protein